MSDWMQRIIESKRAARLEFAAQSYGEKLRIVERLRDAAQMFRASRSVKPLRTARGAK